MTAGASAYSRLRRALDRGNVVEALSSASELHHVGLVEALEQVIEFFESRQEPERMLAEVIRDDPIGSSISALSA